jgi:hypothetical protein
LAANIDRVDIAQWPHAMLWRTISSSGLILLLCNAPVVATDLCIEQPVEALQTLAQKYFPCPTFTHCSFDLIRLLPLHVLYAVISLPVNW